MPNFPYLVGVKRLELPTSCSQSRRATNCATPRFCIKFFALFKMSKVCIIKGFSVFLVLYGVCYGHAPKAGASPSKILSHRPLLCPLLCIFSPQQHTFICHRQRCSASPNCATPRFCIEFLSSATDSSVLLRPDATNPDISDTNSVTVEQHY